MTFKQQLFTILLGLLFATVLTDQASALYDPGVGRFCSRDPIGYADGPNIYQYVRSQPNISRDPFGLDTVIGVIPPNASDARKCIIWQEDAGQRRCYKRCGRGARMFIPCPIPPDDDPEGPSFQDGIDGFMKGRDMLLGICSDCAGSGNCTIEKCKAEVGDIIFRLIAAWQNNYGKGCHPQDPSHPDYHRDPVGGHLCWDWSTIFAEALSGKAYECFNASEWGADEPGGYVHWFTVSVR